MFVVVDDLAPSSTPWISPFDSVAWLGPFCHGRRDKLAPNWPRFAAVVPVEGRLCWVLLVAGRSAAATTAGTPPLTPPALSPSFPLLAPVPGTLLCQDLMSTLLPSPSLGLITLLPYAGPGSLKDDGHVQTAQQGFSSSGLRMQTRGCRSISPHQRNDMLIEPVPYIYLDPTSLAALNI